LNGLAGLGAVGSGFEAKHAEIKACVGDKVKTRVNWTTAGGKMTNVKAGCSDAKISKCLEAALENTATKSPDAVCAITLSHD